MSFYIQELIKELKVEADKTAKMLAKVPFDQLDYAPHEKSMKLGPLTFHVADLPEWIALGILQNELDFHTQKFDASKPQNTEELLARHNKNVAAALAALEGTNEEELQKPWTLKAGDHVIFTMPKSQTVRIFALNHLIHHRAQIGNYLRQLDIPVPGMYGPSADEK